MTEVKNPYAAEMDAKLAEMRKDPEKYFAEVRRRAAKEQTFLRTLFPRRTRSA